MDNHNAHYPEDEQLFVTDVSASHQQGQAEQAQGDELESHIKRVLHEQARRLHVSSTFHQNVMRQLPPRHMLMKAARRRKMTLVLSSALAALLVLTLTLYAMMIRGSSVPPATRVAAITYSVGQTLETPQALANGGQLISVDPTGHYLVYSPAQQPGVLYTTSLTAPVADNLLAMQYAADVAWSPDGTSLVTTVRPEGTFEPLLALVPVGRYMHLLGHDALAASWLPNAAQGITFVTPAHRSTQLWQTDTHGTSLKLLATMPLSRPTHHLYWSPNGRLLALVVGSDSTNSANSFNQPGRSMYIMNSATGGLREVVPPGNFTLGNIVWSPDGQALSYEQVDGQGHSTLYVIAATTGQTLATLAMHGQLRGWSWSPDSHALVYSDGGVLHAYTFHGASIQLPAMSASAADPFWLPNGHILYLRISNGVGQLALLTQR